jgi:2-dehydro-3-deoxygluconokinase
MELDRHQTMRVAAIGECMVELRRVGPGLLAYQYAGDTFNTAYHLKAEAPAVDVQFATVTGDDPYSDEMLQRFETAGIGVDLVARARGRAPGLYLVSVDAAGERTFTYHRSDSAARALFTRQYPRSFDDVIAGCDLLFLSAITLSILDSEARVRLIDLLERARLQGATIAFDTNYRPPGWPSEQEAREQIVRALAHVDIALPTFSDEALLFGDDTIEGCAARHHELGVAEVVIKNGRGDAYASTSEGAVAVPALRDVAVVDTTGAGDAFNAGYLSQRIGGRGVLDACRRAHELAAAVIGVPGAIGC